MSMSMLWRDVVKNRLDVIIKYAKKQDVPFYPDIITPVGNPSLTLDMIDAYPEFTWNWQNLSCSPNMTLEYVLKHRDRNWNWAFLSKYLDMNDIINHLDLPWAMNFMCINSSLTFEHVMILIERGHKDDLDWHFLSIHRNITFDHVSSHLDLPWKWYELSCNPNITIENVLEFIDKPWCGEQLSLNKHITIDDVINHPDIPWDWLNLSRHPNITLENILDHPELHWNWECVSMNPNLTIKHILENIDKPWCGENLIVNPNITFDDIYKNKHVPWCWRYISANPNITVENVLEHPEIKWTGHVFRNVGFDIIKFLDVYFNNCNYNHAKYIEQAARGQLTVLNDHKVFIMKIKRLGQLYISDHHRITYDYVIKHPEFPWNWTGLQNNPTWFKPSESEIRRWWAYKVIGRWIVECLTNPEYKMCRRRLLKEYGFLTCV